MSSLPHDDVSKCLSCQMSGNFGLNSCTLHSRQIHTDDVNFFVVRCLWSRGRESVEPWSGIGGAVVSGGGRNGSRKVGLNERLGDGELYSIYNTIE